MADIRPVTEAFAVAPQIQPEEIGELARRFGLLINNRPDGEEAGQPTHSEIAAAARDSGVTCHHLPIAGAPTADQVRRMRELLQESNGPTLAFCRTGTRSIVAWAAGQALAGQPLPALEAQARAAGYEVGAPLAALLPRLGGA